MNKTQNHVEEKPNTLSPPAATRRNGDGVRASASSKSSISDKSSNSQNGFQIKEISQQEKDFARQAAEKLHAALEKKRRIMRRANLNQWATQIRHCLKTNLAGFDEKEFNDVLTWYCEHIGDDYVKDVRSADAFCENLPSLYRSMKRSGDTSGSRIRATIERCYQHAKSER